MGAFCCCAWLSLSSYDVDFVKGEDACLRFAEGGAIEVLRFPLILSSTGDLADAGVVGEWKALSLGLCASRLALLDGCRINVDEECTDGSEVFGG